MTDSDSLQLLASGSSDVFVVILKRGDVSGLEIEEEGRYVKRKIRGGRVELLISKLMFVRAVFLPRQN